MKILMIECTAEELRANRTVMDAITDTFSDFLSSFAGVRYNPGVFETEEENEDEQLDE